MLTFTFVFFILMLSTLDAQSPNVINTAIARARRYFLRLGRQSVIDENQWLPNSAKIGTGYDLTSGSPVCYTGECQMEGFRLPVFQLDMTKQAKGSCTSKYIPQNVNLDCLPSTQITANTESISTISELMESTKQGIQFSGSSSIYGVSFSYSRSQETRSMINTIYQSNSTVYFTRTKITLARLSAFTPMLELSNEFRYVINNMPCCNESDELYQYIKEFVIDYFGLAYVNDLLLGGIAQQKIVISEENRKKLRENGFTNTNEAELKVAASNIFAASAKITVTEQFDQKKLDVFRKFSQQSSIMTLGGTTSMQSIEDWSKTVQSNPTIIKFGIAPLLDLLTLKRFSSDSNIASKRLLIEWAQKKYMNAPLICYNNCTSPSHGECTSTGYFRFGLCNCQPGWFGISCENAVIKPMVFSGLICGLRTGAGHDCGQVNPETNTCVSGYAYNIWDIGQTGTGRMKFCSKQNADRSVGMVGTICGLTVGRGGPKCGERDPFSEGCPDGYSRYEWWVRWGRGHMVWCYKTKEGMDDLPGTICGLQTNNGDTGPTCDGYQPGRGSCPSGYYLVTWNVSFGNNYLSFCVKQ